MWTIASWNVNSLTVRLPHVLAWLDDNQPDVLALQETKTRDERFPLAAFNEKNYQAIFAGQSTYNGVAILSKHPAALRHDTFPGSADPQKRLLCCVIDDVCVLNLYVPNGSKVGSEKFAYKLDWLMQLDKLTDTLLERHENLVLLGDFNIAPADLDVHAPDEWRGKVLCSDAERECLASLMDKGLLDTFRLFEQAENTFSWWDYRSVAFAENRGLRIDLILASNALAKKCADSWIDAAPREWERPSDHTPVVAEFRL